MKKYIIICAVFFVIAVSLIAVSLLLNWAINDVNFNDNPAILVGISKQGNVTLDTYSGVIVGKLHNVNWSNSSQFYDQVQQIVDKAVIDKVAYSKKRNLQIEVWYQSVEGPINLNDEINKLTKK